MRTVRDAFTRSPGNEIGIKGPFAEYRGYRAGARSISRRPIGYRRGSALVIVAATASTLNSKTLSRGSLGCG
jgi:hypothetical protein